jgi:hypothetical protein
MKKQLLIIISCMTIHVIAHAQNADSLMLRALFNETMSHSGAYENLRVLCKEIGPRLSGSANAEKAVQTTYEMMKRAGADTVYKQPCMVPRWERGSKESGFVMLHDGSKRMLKLCALGNAVSTSKKGLHAEVVEVRSFGQLDSIGAIGISGKIVFFNFPMNPNYLHTFRAYGESGVSRWNGPSQAARYGAVGAMVRSLSSNTDAYPHTGVLGYNDSFPKIPAIAISTMDAEWLSTQISNHHIKDVWFKTSCTMLSDAPSFNVIGEIRGTEHPEEIITIGGHLDSWDLGEGAHDDGAGCMQTIEMLRSFKALHLNPKRTIRFVMYMNEENGGRGGDAYLAGAKKNNENHLFAIESDAGGFSPRGFSLSVSPQQYAAVQSWLPLLAPYEIDRISQGGSGSDIENLSEIGAALAGLRPDSQRYFDVHHAATDVFESVSKRELDLGSFAMAALVYLVDRHGL